jgi:deoxyribonuclease V
METKKLHSWNLSYSQAKDLQKHLASQVQFVPLSGRPQLIAGLDCAISKDKQQIVAVAVVLKAPAATQDLWGGTMEPSDFQLIETTTASERLIFPYIPGLLSFREAPACLAAVEKLKTEPDAFIIDGQGIAHPRRFGLASHLGLFFDKPTIGCAKSRLTGYFEEPPPEKGAYSLLKDNKSFEHQAGYEPRTTNDEVIGAVVRTRTSVEPVFVSVGNKCVLKDAIKITLECTTKYRLPEPTRLAHQLVSKAKLKG